MRNKLIVKLAVAAIAVTGLALTQTAPSPGKTAEQVFKNIQALKGTPADQLIPAMQFISVSLGVECEFCHVAGKMDLDEKKPKDTARQMIAMTAAINKDHFGGHQEMTCFSCHHGSEHPASTPPVQDSDALEHKESAAPASAHPVTADQIIDKYVAALGGEEAIRKVTSRVESGIILAAGQETPIDVMAKAPNKRVSVMHSKSGDSFTAFDGTAGWLGNGGKPARDMSPAESEAAGLDADLHLALNLKTAFKQFRVGRPEKAGDVQCLTLLGTRPERPPVRFFFDEKTGLLARMVRYTANPLGRMPTQIDYADYRLVDGVQVPMRWTLARPNGRFTIQIKDVKQNVPVDDSKFAKPAAGTQ